MPTTFSDTSSAAPDTGVVSTSVSAAVTAAGEPAPNEPIRGRAYAKFAILLGVLTAFAPLSIDMYLPALPAIAQEFGTTTAAVQQTLAVFFIGLALGQALYGPLSDRMGRRGPLLFGCGLYALASIGCALAFSVQSLILLRFIQSLGACAGIVISRSIVRDLFEERESARMYSFLVLVMGVAPITAPLLGGQLLVFFSWRAIFLTLAGYGLLCILLVLFVLRETLPTTNRTRVGLGAVLRTYGGLLVDGRYMGFALTNGLASGAMFAYISGSPFVFIELNGVPADRFGLVFGANALGLITASQMNRWLLTRFRNTQILTGALSVTASGGLLMLALTALDLGGFPALLAVLFCTVASYGLVGPNATAAAMAPFARRAGSAAALLGTVQFAIGAGAGSLVGLLHNGTALPMVGVIALSSTSALICLQFLALRQHPVVPAAQP